MQASDPIRVEVFPKRYQRKPKGKKKPVGIEVFNFDAHNLLERDSAAQFTTTSADGRRHYRQTEDIAPPAFLRQLQGVFSDQVQNDFDPKPFVPGFVDLLEKEISTENATKCRTRRYVSSVSVFFNNWCYPSYLIFASGQTLKAMDPLLRRVSQ